MTEASVSQSLATAGITVFERGWLSANNVLIQGNGPTALVDSGYCSHAPQTLALVSHALQERTLDLLLNTHLHSDHCGGNAALQNAFPGMKTFIPPGQSQAVTDWDPVALTYTPTGQECPRFLHQGLLRPGTSLQLGSLIWEVHGAKGHDPHAIVLHQPETKVLISADALWQNGFGVVFPELEGEEAFDEVGETLDLIESLHPEIVIPGHGAVFQDVEAALQRARSRLEQFRQAPEKHLRHAIKVLIKFRLLEWQRVRKGDLMAWAEKTPYLRQAMPPDRKAHEWMEQLLEELARAKALQREQDWIVNC
jgi:glyoxylase-like metal-dependent hydrolase (beta-lactamase superfamily II)